jgi:hypothetical protein
VVRAAGCVLALLGASLAGCGDGGHQYSSLGDLRKAAVAAGLVCTSWNPQPSWNRPAPHAGVEGGLCSQDAVLVLYTDGQNPEEELGRTISALTDLNVGHPFLVGKNWMINSPDAGDLQDAMGGKIVTLY